MNPTEPIWKSYIVETTESIFTPQQCQMVIDKGMSLKKEDGPTGNYFDTSKGFPNINTAFIPVIGETPEQTFARATNRVNFNQGGLASLNNQDYGMLMGASNFGF